MTNKFYIITRFNAPCFPTRKDLVERRLSEDWLRERIRLFKSYCYPSVMNQSFQDFVWIVWCHPESPEWMREAMKEFHGATVIYADSYYDYIDNFYDTLVTTRLDNDDMIHRDFMKTVSDELDAFNASSQDRMVFSFTRGYRYVEINQQLIKVIMSNSPFLTLFADISQQTDDWSVYCTDHGKLPAKFNTVYNEVLPAWMWIKHDGNTASISTKPDGFDRIGKIFPQFGIEV